MKKLTIKIALFAIFGVAMLFSAGYILKTQTKKKKMMLHVAYIWAKSDISEAEKQKLEAGMQTLLKVKTVKMGYVGRPAATAKRDVVDNSYTYSLFLFFDNVEGHDAYQIDPIHLNFVEGHKQFWTNVMVYDSDITQ